jgi:hypothetical protein
VDVNKWCVLAIVFVVRYFSVETGQLFGANVTYGWTEESCAINKVLVDLQADPEGFRTVTDCVDESEVSGLLAKGGRT